MAALLRQLLARQPLDQIESEETGPKLRRVLGWPGLVGIGLGTMLGGIFTTVGTGAANAGPGVVLAFVISGLACVFVALCYAEFASMVPVAGSAYTYAYATLGEFVAWIIGWDLILEYGISAAPVAASWSGYLQELLRGIGLNLPVWARDAHVAFSGVLFHGGRIDVASTHVDVLAVLVILGISALLAIGIKESASVNTLLVVVQVAAMLLFIGVCFAFVRHANLTPFAPLGLHGIVKSAALVFFAYIGFDTVTVASEEARNPQRDVPIGILVSLFVGALLYLAIAYVTVGVVPWQHVDQTAAMGQAIRMAGHNPWFIGIVGFGAIAGTTTVMVTSLLGQTRIFYVMARDRMLPPSVARIHHRFRTPARMTMITGILVAFLAAVVPLEKLLELVNIGTLSAFSIVCVGVLVLRFAAPHAKRPFRAPFGVASALAGLGLCLWMTFGGLAWATWIRFFVWFAAGVAVYAFYGYRHSRRRQAPMPGSENEPRWRP